jgi:adenylate kinase family enzyme
VVVHSDEAHVLEPVPARSQPRRIIVIGGSGAGKTTLAAQLSERLGVPHIELDALHWEPNWVEADTEVFRERVRQATAADAWVICGAYSKQRDISWPRADTIVWLDLPLHVQLSRVIGRSWRRYRSGELLWGSNREDFWTHFRLWETDRSLIAYLLKTHWRRRRDYQQLMADPRWSHLTFVRLRSPREVRAWLDAMTPATPPARRAG